MAKEFKKGWVERFRSQDTELKVRKAFQSSTLRTSRPRAVESMKMPVIKIAKSSDIPEELTVREVAQKLRFKDPESVTAIIRKGELFAQKQGREWRIPLWAFAQYLARRPSNHAA